MGAKPKVSGEQQDPALAELQRKQAEEQKKLEKERIEQERARFSGGGGSLFTPTDQKQTLGG